HVLFTEKYDAGGITTTLFLSWISKASGVKTCQFKVFLAPNNLKKLTKLGGSDQSSITLKH
ncbi:TPA: hypothetical protein ACQ88G_005032, partial [Escherichia coli]